jgi:hypothetical protein
VQARKAGTDWIEADSSQYTQYRSPWRSFTIDNEPAVATMTSTSQGILEPTFLLAGGASDNMSGVRRVAILRDGSSLADALLTQPDANLTLWELLVDVLSGDHTYQACAHDNAGNPAGCSQTITLTGAPNVFNNSDTRKVASALSVKPNELITYTLWLSNSDSITLTPTITDAISSWLEIVSVTPPTTTQVGNTLVWDVPVPGMEMTSTVVVARVVPGSMLTETYTLTNTAAVGVDGLTLMRTAEPVLVTPWRAFLPFLPN